MNLKAQALALLACSAFFLTACGDSGSSAGNGTYCRVSSTSTTVKVDAAYMGESYTSVATQVSDDVVTYHSVYGYATQAEADKACANFKEEASYWLDGSYKVACSGTQVTVDEHSEYMGLASEGLVEAEADFNEMCGMLQNMAD
ncbi:hypothetical protein [Fibrobacter sp. HC4]|uniref:hypothetical protein n=1 Tax=Fibrobacter sp. HC4 TaxID=3239812 RepID=UPI000C710B1F|nr:hypothetical protein [Fibrobacter succinogenes]MCL4101162.1 hypothetical protein [Fibrobacter succinogenes]